MSVEEMFKKVRAGEITQEEFESWVYEREAEAIAMQSRGW